MRQVLLTMLLLLLSAGTGVAGEPEELNYEHSIAPWFGSLFGHTQYELDFGVGRSELVFPLDVKQAGLELGYRAMAGDRPVWTLNVRLAFNLGNPGTKMTDRDWVRKSGELVEFSSSKSTAEGSVASIAGEFTHLLYRGEKVDLAAVVGVEYQRIQQDLVDLEGWQWNRFGPKPVIIPTYKDDDLAGTYEVRYFRPQLGLMPRLYLGPVTLMAKGVVSPLLHVRDIDDHVRRHFQIRTDGKGFGWGGGLAVEWNEIAAKQHRMFGRLSGDISKTSIDTKGARIFYARELIDLGEDLDDPSDDVYAEVGDRFLEEHKISSTQYAIRLTVGFRF